ncbi:MAG: hypothetical protein U9P72_02730 [Campylobacterota bacterium]|nr:hypothetical protein [Campylobacterota bacterium]
MHNSFENLQKRCKRYRLKKRVIVVLPIIITMAIVGAYLSLEKPPKPTVVKKEIVKVKKVVTPPTTVTKDVAYSLKVDTTYVPKPKTVITYAEYVAPAKKVAPVKKAEPIKKIRAKEPVNTEVQEYYVDKKDSKPLSISVTKLQSVEQMVTLYNKEKKYSLALKIAKSYYNSKEYSKALRWAKKANVLDRKDDGAWILYAKSEYAKGNHKRAVKILNLYLTNANSSKAQSLLSTWKKQP